MTAAITGLSFFPTTIADIPNMQDAVDFYRGFPWAYLFAEAGTLGGSPIVGHYKLLVNNLLADLAFWYLFSCVVVFLFTFTRTQIIQFAKPKLINGLSKLGIPSIMASSLAVIIWVIIIAAGLILHRSHPVFISQSEHILGYLGSVIYKAPSNILLSGIPLVLSLILIILDLKDRRLPDKLSESSIYINTGIILWDLWILFRWTLPRF